MSTRRLRARLARLEPFLSVPGDDRDRDRRRYEELNARKLEPGGLTHSEEVEFSKLDALYKDLDRWEELSWKKLSNKPLTEEETREYAELDARLSVSPKFDEVQDDYEDIFGGYAEVLKSIQSAAELTSRLQSRRRNVSPEFLGQPHQRMVKIDDLFHRRAEAGIRPAFWTPWTPPPI